MRTLCASLMMAICAGMAGAQQTVDPTLFEVPSAQVAPTILTIDVDRMFAQSQFGERLAQQYTQEGAALAEEQRRVAQALREEELALAAQRVGMDPDLFQIEAAAFDEKAQGIRRAQDAKEQALEEILTQGRAQFIETTRPILGQMMLERGAFAILDRRSVVLSLSAIDVTDDAIARINASLGDGTDSVPEE